MPKFLLFFHFFITVATAVLLIFTILIGVNTKAPFNNIYWSQLEVSSATTVRYTNYGACVTNAQGKSSECTTKFAYGYQPVASIASGDQSLLKNANTLYRVSRVAYILLLVAVVASLVSLFFAVFVALTKARPGSVNIFVVTFGFLLSVAGAAMNTYVHVYTTSRYNKDGFKSSIGSTAFGLVWGSVVAFLLSVIAIWAVRVRSLQIMPVQAGPYAPVMKY